MDCRHVAVWCNLGVRDFELAELAEDATCFCGWYEGEEDWSLVDWFLFPDLYYGMWQTGQRGGRGTYPRKTEVSSLKIKVKNLFSLSETVNYQQQQKHIPPRFIVVEKNMFFKCQPAPVLTLLFLSLLKFPTPSPAGNWVMFCRWALLRQLSSARVTFSGRSVPRFEVR